MKEIAYEKHPVSDDRIKELNSKGIQILDERFKPANYKEPVKPQAQPAQKPKTEVKD